MSANPPAPVPTTSATATERQDSLAFIIDEEGAIRQFVSLILQGGGVDTIEFIDGASFRDTKISRVPDLVPYCERHGLKMITVADLVEYRRRHEKLVERGASVRLRGSRLSQHAMTCISMAASRTSRVPSCRVGSSVA